MKARRDGPLLTGERKAALAILAVLLAGGTWFVIDQLQFCGPRCSTAIEDTGDLNRLAREQGISRADVPPCEGAGGVAPTTASTAPGDVTALASSTSGVLYAAGPDGAIWTATAGDVSAPLTAWSPAGAPVTVSGAVTALAVLDNPAQLLVAMAEPAQAVVLDIGTGEVVHRWELPQGAVAEMTMAGNNLLVVDSASGAVLEASSNSSGEWGELKELRGPGEFEGATDVFAGRSGGGVSRPVALVADPDRLRMIDVNTGGTRVLVGEGPGVDRPTTTEAAALVQSQEFAAVDGTVLLVDAGQVRPVELDAQWFSVGVGQASTVEGLGQPVSATGLAGQVVVADGSTTIRVVSPPSCAG